MKKYIEKLLGFLLVIYKEYGRIAYPVLIVVILFLSLLTVEFNPEFASHPTLRLERTIIGALVLSGLGVLFVLGDLLRLGVRPTPTHTELVAKLRREEPFVDDVIKGRLERLKKTKPGDEKEMVEALEEIMHVVRGEVEFVPIFEVIKLFMRIMVIVALYTLISMNLTCYSKVAIFNTLSPHSNWLSYLYNTVAVMFLVGYDAAFPVHDLARLVTIAEIISGIFALVVVLDFVLTSAYQDMDSLRDALRSYLILCQPTMV